MSRNVIRALIYSRNCQVWGSSRDCLPRHSGCEQHGGCLFVPRGPEAVRHREEDVSRGGAGLETGQGPGLEVSSKLIIENLLSNDATYLHRSNIFHFPIIFIDYIFFVHYIYHRIIMIWCNYFCCSSRNKVISLKQFTILLSQKCEIWTMKEFVC